MNKKIKVDDNHFRLALLGAFDVLETYMRATLATLQQDEDSGLQQDEDVYYDVDEYFVEVLYRISAAIRRYGPRRKRDRRNNKKG